MRFLSAEVKTKSKRGDMTSKFKFRGFWWGSKCLVERVRSHWKEFIYLFVP